MLKWLAGSACALVFCVGAQARADHLDVDIEKLDAEGALADGGFSIGIRYKVELEHIKNGVPPLAIEFRVEEAGRPVVDAEGRPIGVSVPLDFAHSANDHEIKFENVTDVFVPQGLVRFPGELRITANVVAIGGGAALKAKSTRVKMYLPPPPIIAPPVVVAPAPLIVERPIVVERPVVMYPAPVVARRTIVVRRPVLVGPGTAVPPPQPRRHLRASYYYRD